MNSAARKNVIAAANVSACACGSNMPRSCTASYGAACMFAARMLPLSRNGFHTGHSACASEWRTAACHEAYAVYRAAQDREDAAQDSLARSTAAHHS